MRIYLPISALLLLVLTSCSTNKVLKDCEAVPLESIHYLVPYFSDATIDYVYKANITAYGNELTGIFIAKKINETTHRVVFTTEFGNKLLDFEISENDFKINSIVEELNRKILINTLKKDFRLLLKSDFLIDKQYKNATYKIVENKEGKYSNYIFSTTLDNKLVKIVHATKTKEKINIIFTTENNIFAQNIEIQHYNIKLKIVLNKIN